MKIDLKVLSNELAHCSPTRAGCTGGAEEMLRFEPENGVIPRCLYLQRRIKDASAAVVVGANPGILKTREQMAIVGSGNASRTDLYANWIRQFEAKFLNEYRYFTQPRALLDGLGIAGDILWTEIYKCENYSSIADFHCRPAVVCSDKFLENELRYMSQNYDNYLVLACGGNAYHFLRNEFWNNPSRRSLIPRLVGTYHPSGGWSRGKFNSMFKPDDKKSLLPSVLEAFESASKEPFVLHR